MPEGTWCVWMGCRGLWHAVNIWQDGREPQWISAWLSWTSGRLDWATGPVASLLTKLTLLQPELRHWEQLLLCGDTLPLMYLRASFKFSLYKWHLLRVRVNKWSCKTEWVLFRLELIWLFCLFRWAFWGKQWHDYIWYNHSINSV